MPIALLRALFEMANKKARDIENKKRFPKATIGEGASFTPDVTHRKTF